SLPGPTSHPDSISCSDVSALNFASSSIGFESLGARNLDADDFLDCVLLLPRIAGRTAVLLAALEEVVANRRALGGDVLPGRRLIARFWLRTTENAPPGRRGVSGVTTGRRDMYLYICGSVGGR